MKKPPELLAPAGSLRMAQAAFDFGANAIYAGQPRYSLRVRNNEFGDLGKLKAAIDLAHTRGGQCYVVSNIYPHNAKLKTYLEDMAPVVALRPDALIMADPGLMAMIRETWPEMPIHLSVQANTLNYAAVRFWRSMGVTRVILSRELSLDEIAEIRQQCPEMELEVFVHGALCVAYSGRCLLSGYFNHRDPNQGACTNSCRWRYDVKYLIEEETRPGEPMPIEEDEHGTYILNSKDLRAIEYVGRLVAAGVDSLKIEGRTKSAYYVARTCQAYRQAIDDARAGKPFDTTLLAGLDDLANRGYTPGFYDRHPDQEYQNYLSGLSKMGASQYVGDVIAYADGLAEIEVKNRFAVGDRLEIIHPAGNAAVTVGRMEKVGADGAASETRIAPGSGHRVRIPLPPDKEGAFLARLGSDG